MKLDQLRSVLRHLSALPDRLRRIEHALEEIDHRLTQIDDSLLAVQRPRLASVLVIGEAGDPRAPYFAAWSKPIPAGGFVHGEIWPQLPLHRGAWVIGLGGTALEGVRVGAMACDLTPSCGPIARTSQTVMPGVVLHFVARID